MIKDRDYYSFGFFVPYSIKPEPSIIAKLLTHFKEWNLLPNTLQKQGVFQESPLNSIYQLQLFTENKELVIDFEPFRYHIQSFGIKEGAILSFDEFVKRSEKLVSFMYELNNMKAHRLSFATKALCKEMTKDKLVDVNKKLFNLPQIFNDNEPIEWSSRQITRIERNINDRAEIINLITDVNRIQGVLSSEGSDVNFDRIEIKFDINTFQGNTDQRFDYKDVSPFLNLANDLKNEIEKELKSTFYEEE